MNRPHLLLGLVLLISTGAWAQPVLRSQNPVLNATSYASGIAQGSIFAVFGTNLGVAQLTYAPGLPLPTTLAGASIRFTPVAGGNPVDALMVYTTQNQLAGLLPSTAPVGDYNVTVTLNNQTSAPAKVSVVARNFGVVTADASGGGLAQGEIFRGQDFFLTRFTSSTAGGYKLSVANPGDLVVLFGTGLGADAKADVDGTVSSDFKAITTVTVGTKQITPSYAARLPGYPGTDQINIVLPADVETGCYVPVVIKVGDTTSNVTAIPIAATGKTTCDHPYLSADLLKKASETGSATIASYSLSKLTTSASVPIFGSIDISSESISGGIARYNFSALGSLAGTAGATAGLCRVFRQTGSLNTLVSASVGLTYLDAGAQLALNGPNASNVAVPRGTDNYYSATLSSGGIPGLPGGGSSNPVIAAGTYTLTAPGGNDVGSFSASVAVPSPLDWTNKAQITSVNRSQPLTLTWTGGGTGTVEILGVSGTRISGSTTDGVYDAAIFLCEANASAGTFTVPTSILSQLPAASGDLLTGTTVGLLGLESAGIGTTGKFTAPLKPTGNTDFGLFNYSVVYSKILAYQ